MSQPLLRTTVIGSYPFPGWLEFACQNLDKFGEADREELIDDAVTAAMLMRKIAFTHQVDLDLDAAEDCAVAALAVEVVEEEQM